MRRCTKRTCNVILLDSDVACPVCGSDTVDAGSPQKTKQSYDNEPTRIAIPRRRISLVSGVFWLIVATAVLYYVYTHLINVPAPEVDGSVGQRFLDRLTRGPQP